ncbi:PadR family transcriptional regulator [[Clostridium] sordellii]|uniref:PadR family transcriptional regulator n=1 Tax=Paraclostridium sordellii TaxID=1505 RepID=UPI0003864F34|nr:PadR family transcriptional regulator [Paeniclostridium sordellii]EPZ56724.1 transcriptional regulator PadR-like family protein [[Clostridium] sordellii VPI 9048] [Paeniclostridium sordellii VPI 9048]MCR1848326.1 PadR family transcriptional regulator [Paeniclostridium sordellii]MDU2147599.1 PadR family transcriptional regulator [Paeniclostridium sordellii]MDU2687770.1 PadR family transcriptional regulator [Paeniclostridium sordellii]MVO72969.1 PadR family transcriptional regulator [Paeniclo
MSFQISSTILDACVLAVLNNEDTYGYLLTQQVKEVVDISESTLYPVLRRLQKNNYLITYDKAFQGRNRRYYQITNLGKNQYKEYLRMWEDYKNSIDKILLGGNKIE